MSDMTSYGKLSIVGTPIGNLGDFSPRGIETLTNADYIAAEDTRVTLGLLTKFDIKKPLVSCYKPKEQEKSERIIELLINGNNVAMVSDAGMPCISDPGAVLVRKCYERGIPVEVIPGCNAAVAAVEAVDSCVGKTVEAIQEMGGVAMITADHGNADQMLEDDEVSPFTAHSCNPVPFCMVGYPGTLHEGRLADIAPTMLQVLGLEQPAEMDGKSLID